MAESQLERCPRGGGDFFAGGATKLSKLVLISKNQNKKRPSRQISLHNSKCSADLKKKVIIPNWSTFPRVLCWSQKNKNHRLETAARKGQFGGACWQVWGAKFLFGRGTAAAPFASPSCGPVKWFSQSLVCLCYATFIHRLCNGAHEKNQRHFVIKDITVVINTFFDNTLTILFVIQASVT